MDSVEVVIANFEKYKGRGDVENPTWFRCSNRLLEDPDFYHLSFPELAVWVQIMCLSSRKRSATVVLSFEHCDRACRLPREVIVSAIEKLRALKILLPGTSLLRRRNAAVTSTSRIQQTDRQTDRDSDASNLKFEEIYSAYPRKVGKAAGMLRLKKMNPNLETIELLIKAAKEYSRQCLFERTDVKFIKHFSSWIGTEDKETWRDYIPLPAKPHIEPVTEFKPHTEDVAYPSEEDRKERLLELKNAMSKIGLKITQKGG